MKSLIYFKFSKPLYLARYNNFKLEQNIKISRKNKSNILILSYNKLKHFQILFLIYS